MRVWITVRLRKDATGTSLEALLRELDVLGCRVRLDLAEGCLHLSPPWPNLNWNLHGGLEDILRRYRSCLQRATPSVTPNPGAHAPEGRRAARRPGRAGGRHAPKHRG